MTLLVLVKLVVGLGFIVVLILGTIMLILILILVLPLLPLLPRLTGVVCDPNSSVAARGARQFALVRRADGAGELALVLVLHNDRKLVVVALVGACLVRRALASLL